MDERPPLSVAIRAALPTTIFVGVVLFVLVPLLWGQASVLKAEIVLIGVLGLWRYGWQLFHHLRAWTYRLVVFPALRNRAESHVDPWPQRLWVMVMSYKEEPEVSAHVFRALMDEIWRLPCEIHLVVSVGGEDEAEHITEVLRTHQGWRRVSLTFMRQQEGKRTAMGHALRAIGRRFYDPVTWNEQTWKDDIVIFMDGDSRVDRGAVSGSLPLFRVDPKLAAVTTDERAHVVGSSLLVQHWFDLKFIRRHLMMQSHALSGRVLTLTGRFSVFRAHVVLAEEFIARLEADTIDHWLFGEVRFLMGDDKSTWFSLLQDGWRMLYVPDVTVTSLESRTESFRQMSLPLMRRWFGNMLRTNARAIRLGPGRVGGPFIWWCIVDQRISMWTTLVGPSVALLGTITTAPLFLPFYLCWVAFTRLLQVWLLVLHGFRMRFVHLPLLVFDQWVGAVVKIQALFHLDRQQWKKGVSGRTGDGRRKIWVAGLASFRMLLWVAAFLFFVGLGSGLLLKPNLRDVPWPRRHVSEASAYVAATPRAQTPRPTETAEPTTTASATPREAWATPAATTPAAVADPSTGAQVLAREHGVIPDDGQDDSAALKALIDRLSATGPRVVVLPEGELTFEQPLVIDQGDLTIRGAGAGVTVIRSRIRANQGEAVIHVRGRAGPVAGALTSHVAAKDIVLPVDDGLGWVMGEEQVFWVGAPNDDEFLAGLDSGWRRELPWLRQALVRGRATEQGIELHRPIGMELPASSLVRLPRLIRNVHLEEFSIVQEVPGASADSSLGDYRNAHPQHAVDGVRFEWTEGAQLEDVEITMAGRHPLVFEESIGGVARDVQVSGAWNKGPGGNGYVRFARAFDCRIEDSLIEGVRHLAFQWSSAGNRVTGSTIRTDVNFHGGQSRDNRVEGSLIQPPDGHPWPQVVRTGPSADWAPPDLWGNHVDGVPEDRVAVVP
jgi:mannuronan synthase